MKLLKSSLNEEGKRSCIDFQKTWNYKRGISTACDELYSGGVTLIEANMRRAVLIHLKSIGLVSCRNSDGSISESLSPIKSKRVYFPQAEEGIPLF